MDGRRPSSLCCGSLRRQRLAASVAFRNRSRHDAFPTDLSDRDEAGFQVRVEARLGAIAECASFGDGQVAVFETILQREGGPFRPCRDLNKRARVSRTAANTCGKVRTKLLCHFSFSTSAGEARRTRATRTAEAGAA